MQCHVYGSVAPVFEEISGGSRVVLFNEKQSAVVENEGLNSVLLAILKHGGIQAKNLSTLLNGRPIKTIERQIAGLVGRGLIERRGSRKTGGYWLK